MTNFIHSERRNADLPLGNPIITPYTSDHIAFADVLKEIDSSLLPPVPANFGHGLVYGQNHWGMMGNGPCTPSTTTIPAGYAARQGAGDCVEAGSAHDIMLKAAVNGGPVPPISDYTPIKWYATDTGYNPQTGKGDNGTDPQQFLKKRQTVGIPDDTGTLHIIGPTFKLEPGNLTELYYTAYLCECAGVAVDFQQAQMDQYDNYKPWAYVPGSPAEGGHWIIVVSENGLITWGTREGYESSWYTNLCRQALGWIDILEYNAKTGESAEGLDQMDVTKYMTLVAQNKAA